MKSNPLNNDLAFLISEFPPPNNIRVLFFVDVFGYWAFGKSINGRIIIPDTIKHTARYWSYLPESPE